MSARRAHKWWGWGAAETTFDPPPAFLARLAAWLGGPITKGAPQRVPPALPPARAVAIPCEAMASDEERILHACGRSYVDLIRLRRAALERAPDAVAFPASSAEVEALMRVRDAALVPFGGGTSVVGGVTPLRGGKAAVVSVDMSRMQRVIDVDRVSMTVTAEAGIFGPDLEAALQPHGLTLGHFPQSFEYSTLGGWIATRSAGQESTYYGTIAGTVVGVTAVTPRGTIATRPVPSSATGPEMREMLVGSEGAFGIITEATMRLRPLPATRVFRSFLLPSFEAGVETCRTILQSGLHPAVMRLSDETETAGSFALAGTSPFAQAVLRRLGRNPGAHLLLSSVGLDRIAAREASAMARIARAHGGLPLGSSPGHKWSRDRFRHPYLRDGMIDAGLFVETFETATSWSNLLPLRAAIKVVLRGVIACHVSHGYSDGASLYFTVIDRVDAGDEERYWTDFKRDTLNAIVCNGGTVSHHHGVGADHRPWMPQEHGELAMRAFCRLKEELDPEGLMNPGKLV
jgi:alkyldihydroxyacetonephosphate synthase